MVNNNPRMYKNMKYRRNITNIRRTPDGRIFGVCSGLAHWANLDVDKFELIVFLVTLFTGFFPMAIMYIVLALVIPAEEEYEEDEPRSFFKDFYNYHKETKGQRKNYTYHAKDREQSNDSLKREYEELKKKVEEMESHVFDKENDWDNRFHETHD
jgi:phage shock protein C